MTPVVRSSRLETEKVADQGFVLMALGTPRGIHNRTLPPHMLVIPGERYPPVVWTTALGLLMEPEVCKGVV
jgi:hypothetical protein